MKKKRIPKKAISLGMAIVIAAGTAGYIKYSINSGINPQQVYYTKVDIPPRTKITKDMVQARTVPNDAIPPNAVTNMNDIVGKYTVNEYGVSENSFLFKDKIVKKEDLPDAAILNLKENEVAFPLLVDIETSSGNSIIPNSYVDLYFKGMVQETDANGNTVEKPVFGRVAQHVRVTSVKDSNAANVFDSQGVKVDGSYEENLTNEAKQRPMAKIYTFAVSEEENEVLNKGALIGKIIPVASGDAYKQDVDVENEDKIVKWIKSQSYDYKLKEK